MGTSELLRSEVHDLMGNWKTAAENMRGNSCGCYGSIFVTDLGDVGNVRDIRDVRYVPDVGDVDLANISLAAVIPREERLSGPKRKPSGQFTSADTDANREIRPADECN